MAKVGCHQAATSYVQQLCIYNPRHTTMEAVKLLRKLAVFFLFTAGALAQTAPQKTVINAGRLLDVKSGRMLANQQIVIEGDKIASVGAAATVPAGARV